MWTALGLIMGTEPESGSCRQDHSCMNLVGSCGMCTRSVVLPLLHAACLQCLKPFQLCSMGSSQLTPHACAARLPSRWQACQPSSDESLLNMQRRCRMHLRPMHAALPSHAPPVSAADLHTPAPQQEHAGSHACLCAGVPSSV